MNLDKAADIYDKSHKRRDWANGPNTMFFNAYKILRSEGYDYMFQMELDVQPLRPDWLRTLQNVFETHTHGWIIGSSFLGDCCWDPVKGECIELHQDIRYHINGNAIYNLRNSSAMAAIIKKAQTKYGSWAYDVALYMTMMNANAVERRRIMTRYIHHPFIQNFGTYPVKTEMLDDSTWFVHSNDVMPMQPSLRVIAQKAVSLKDDRGNLIVTFGTNDRRHAIVRFLRSMSSQQIENILVIAWDYDLYAYLLHKTPVALYEPKQRLSHRRLFGDDTFFFLNALRFKIIHILLHHGIHIFSCDSDVIVGGNVWMHLPWQYDLAVQSDARDGVSLVESDPHLLKRLRSTSTSTPYLNAGVFYVRSTLNSIAFFASVWDVMRRNMKQNEQDTFTRAVLSSHSSQLKWTTLSPCLFPNGWVYEYRRVCGRTPVVAHLNWHSEADKKWLSQDRYASDRYLRFTWGNLKDNGFNNCHSALRSALAISSILNRTLLVPDFPLVHLEPSSVPVTFYYSIVHMQKYFSIERDTAALHDDEHVQIDIGYPDLAPSVKVAFTALHGYKGATETEILAHLRSTARVLNVGRLNRRFSRMDSAVENANFNQNIIRGLIYAPHITNIIDHTRARIRKRHGDYNCVHMRILSEFLHDHPEYDTPGVHIRKLANQFSAHIGIDLPLLVLLDDDAQRRVVHELFSSKFSTVFFIDDLLPRWEEVVYKDAQSKQTMAQGVIEANVCARASAFVGDIMSSYTQNICYLRAHLSKPQCMDFFSREM